MNVDAWSPSTLRLSVVEGCLGSIPVVHFAWSRDLYQPATVSFTRASALRSRDQRDPIPNTPSLHKDGFVFNLLLGLSLVISMGTVELYGG